MLGYGIHKWRTPTFTASSRTFPAGLAVFPFLRRGEGDVLIWVVRYDIFLLLIIGLIQIFVTEQQSSRFNLDDTGLPISLSCFFFASELVLKENLAKLLGMLHQELLPDLGRC